MLSLMKLGPDSAGCHGEAAKTLASVTLSRCFQQIGRAPPALGALLSRSRLGHTWGCSPAESTHGQGGEGARGSCEHQAHFTVFSSSKAPQSKVLLPAGYSPTPLLHLPHSSPNPPSPPPPPANKTNRHSSRHLQDILVAGLGCDFVPSYTRVSAPSGQRWRCHFVSALWLVPVFFTSDIHYFHIKT